MGDGSGYPVDRIHASGRIQCVLPERERIEVPGANWLGAPLGIVGSGYYSPYYTPRNLLIHSVIAAFTGYDSYGFVARLGGAYGVRASEDAPVFVTGNNPSSRVLVTYRRNSNPWNVRASVDRPIARNAAISIHAGHSKTSFYSATTAALELTWRLAPR